MIRNFDDDMKLIDSYFKKCIECNNPFMFGFDKQFCSTLCKNKALRRHWEEENSAGIL